MHYFRGRLQRSLDPKGRIILPPEFREILFLRSPEGRLALTTYDGCVVGFPWPDWLDFEHKLNSIKVPDARTRNFRRQILGGVQETTLDGQGRIRLVQTLAEYAGITQDATLMGVGPRFEIWSPERLNPVLNDNYDDVAQALAETGIDLMF